MKLELHTKPEVPLEAESITPAVINKLKVKEIEKLKIYHGNREVNIADFFSISDNKSELLEVSGDMHKIKYLGANMKSGEIQIEGDVGAHLGSAMSGGFIKVNGNTGDWIAPEMSGGRIHITGNSGHCVACAYRGASKGTTGGEIIIEGNVKNELGHGMSNTTILVGGNTGDFTGVNMHSGTILVLGEAGIRTGAGMKRGTIVCKNNIEVLPTFSYDCIYNPVYLKLFFKYVKENTKFKIEEKFINGSFHRWSGDAIEMNRGELLIYSA
jgi:formylmethanofuran dehydrogenase subunit C